MGEERAKKRLMYIVFALVFLFGGIEYSVILPTLWLYLENTYNSPEYIFGLVLSAYSVAACISSPILGRLVDRFRCPKQIFIICACFEVAGSFLYFIGISQWLCIVSRFISGLGGAGEGVAIAEVARMTTEHERTSIISKLVAIRQLALLAGPGLNLVLRLSDFRIGPFEVNKYSAPGAFMTAMWFILIILILAIFTNPPKHGVDNHAYEEIIAPKEENMNCDNPVERSPADAVATTSEDLNPSGHLCQSVNHSYPNEKLPRDEDVARASEQKEIPDFLGSSYDIMVSAELYMHPSDLEYQNISSEDYDDSGSLHADMNYFAPPSPTYQHPSIQRRRVKKINENYIASTTSALEDPIQREGKLNFIYNEYIRDEIVAILMLFFCSFFSQICLETMVTPLSNIYLDFGELENSLLFCISGVVIILAFVIVSLISKHVTDRNLILFGGFLLLAANIWLIIFLPKAPKHDFDHNVPLFSVAVFFDVFSLPFLIVCATSLYSKLTRKETQGLSQGIRRGVVGLAAILAPLWSSPLVKQLYIMLGVMIGIQSLSMILCLFSFSRLKVPGAVAAGKNGTIQSETKVPQNSQEDSLSSASQNSLLETNPTSYGSFKKNELKGFLGFLTERA